MKNSSSSETIPATLVINELDALKRAFAQALAAYGARVETAFDALHAAVASKSKQTILTTRQLRDLRDMLALCRNLRIKPEKGRRKDLKAFESLLEQMRLISENW